MPLFLIVLLVGIAKVLRNMKPSDQKQQKHFNELANMFSSGWFFLHEYKSKGKFHGLRAHSSYR